MVCGQHSFLVSNRVLYGVTNNNFLPEQGENKTISRSRLKNRITVWSRETISVIISRPASARGHSPRPEWILYAFLVLTPSSQVFNCYRTKQYSASIGETNIDRALIESPGTTYIPLKNVVIL